MLESVDNECVFGGVHTCFESNKRVGSMDWHSLLCNDWTVVDAFVWHKMHHDSGLAASALCEFDKCPLDGASAWQFSRKCGMNVDDLIWKLREKTVG